MTVSFQLPTDLEEQFRNEFQDLDKEAKEAMLIEFYRQDKLSRHELSKALGISRFEMDAVLKKHNVTEDLPTSEELEEDLRQAMRLVDR